MQTGGRAGIVCRVSTVKEIAADCPPEEGDLLYEAWVVIANSGVFGNPGTPSPGCREAAVRWRDEFHAYLAARRTSP